jgi:hypothetical protein
MKIFLLLAVSLLISCNNPTETKSDSDLLLNGECSNSIFTYLNIDNISELHVEYYKSMYSTAPGKTVIIKNPDTIKKVADLLKALPDTGEILIKFGSDAYKNNVILVQSNTKSDTVILIGNLIKSPVGPFYRPEQKEQIALVNLVVDPVIQKNLR